MADERTMKQAWQEYRAPKTTVFWCCAGCVALSLIVGFTWGGWVTGGTAAEMADSASDDARAQLAATICVERFMGAANAQDHLVSLKDTIAWQRDDFITEGGWAKVPGLEDPVPGSADVCAQRLAEMQAPVAESTAQTEPTTVAQ